ncbi:MAG TPA: DeoR/GlpR family DNA-binding transcription regulator, partial [Symbiobacteriaceae bacterium]|nr:DeoR/GlpR family DNA-binding transcription regulator [Symbiobacteriaceae bacterium]
MGAKHELRHRRILEILNDGSECHIDFLARAVGVSLATMRRDLERLDQAGLLVRTHGGARPKKMGHFKPSYADRMNIHRAEKLAIVKEAMKLVCNHDTIALCNGTTTHYLAKAICQSGLEVTVITNAIDSALEMAAYPKVRSILIGGEVSEGYTLGGFWSEMILKRAPRVDKAFLGADGVSLTHGLTAYFPNDASMHSHMASLADQVIAL